MKPRLTRKFKIESAKKMSRFCILLAVSLTTLISGFSLLPIEVHAEEVEICGYDPMVSPAISFGDGKCVNEKYSCAKVSVSLASQFKAMALASIGIWTSGMNIETTVKTLYSCCVCEIPNEQPKKIGDARFTRESCEEACKKLSPPAHAYKQAGAGALDVAIKPPASATQSAKNKMMTCFTEKVCTGKEYGGTFKAGDGCPAGQGSCIAPEPVVKLSYPIGTVSTVQGYRGFVATIFQYILSIVATVAAVMFVWGGFRYIFGSAIGSIQSGKEIMIDSVVGLLLVLGAYTILQTINPQTLNLNKLEVKLIKRQLLLSETEFCKLDINYADAGDPPGTVDYNGASFDKGVQQTRCNYSYYPKDLGGEICMGTRCDDLGKVCMACEAGYKQCSGRESGFACIGAGFIGSIYVKDGRNPKEVNLMAVCNWVQPPKDFSQVADNIPDFIELDLSSSKEGSVGFSLSASQEDIDKLAAKCQDKDGLRGFVLGVKYEDTNTLPEQILKHCAFGPLAGKLACSVGVLKEPMIDVDDVLIVTRKDCGTAGPYSGYADGRTLGDFGAMQEAFYCGYISPPRLSEDRNHVFDDLDSIYWRYADISKAIAGQSKPATCTFSLNDEASPTDPTLLNKYGWGCTKDKTP